MHLQLQHEFEAADRIKKILMSERQAFRGFAIIINTSNPFTLGRVLPWSMFRVMLVEVKE